MTAPRPDADPGAFTCEWCEDGAADGYSPHAVESWWVPTCADCRAEGGTVTPREVAA